MRILLFITKSEQGGAQTHVAQLCEWLTQNGHEVSVMSRPGGWLEEEAHRLGARFFPNEAIANSVGPLALHQASKQFLSAVNEFHPDLVACHSTMAGLIGRLTLRGRVPTIFTAHGWGFTQGAPLLRRLILPFLERLAGRWSRRIICVSKNDLALATSHHITSATKLTVIYNGVASEYSHRRLTEGTTLSRNAVSPISKFGPKGSRQNDLKVRSQGKSHDTRIFFVGRLAPPKDPFLLVEAFTRLPHDVQSQARITIIGDGPDRGRLEQTIQEHQLTDSIELTGSLSREQVLARLRNEADIFVLLSHWEGFPYSVLEAMAAGVPVIASNVGGISEALEYGGGILVDNNVEHVAQALQTLLKDEQTRTRLGEEAHRTVVTHFTVTQMCEKTFAVYERALLQ